MVITRGYPSTICHSGCNLVSRRQSVDASCHSGSSLQDEQAAWRMVRLNVLCNQGVEPQMSSNHNLRLLVIAHKGWLVVWNSFLFFHILGIIIPTDSYFSEGLKPPTSKALYYPIEQALSESHQYKGIAGFWTLLKQTIDPWTFLQQPCYEKTTNQRRAISCSIGTLEIYEQVRHWEDTEPCVSH